jgi:hypothetical protein
MGKLVRITLPITLGVMLLILVTATTLHATPVPEIDPTSAIAPAALVAGAVLVIRGRIKR